MSAIRWSVLLLLWPALLAGCGSGSWGGGSWGRAPSYQKLMQSADPKERARGCKLAGESKDRTAIPLLVDRLEDTDSGVRFFAEWALRVSTDKDFVYRETDPPAVRAQAVARWRAYARTLAQPGGGKP